MSTTTRNMPQPDFYGPDEPDEEKPQELGLAALDVLTRSEINQQIQAALAHPRDVSKFRKELTTLATTNEAVAAECFYTLKRYDSKAQKDVFIVGPSIRFAEMLVYCWGNTRAGARVVSTDGEFLQARGVFQDLERNNSDTFEVQRRITNASGQRFKADMIQVTGNAACSLAYRNAVTHGIPKALWNDIFEQTKLTAAGKAEHMGQKRQDLINHAAKFFVTPDMIFSAVNVSGLESIGAEELAVLRGLFKSIRDGEMTVEDAFGNPQDAEIKALMEQLGFNEGQKAMAKSNYKGRPIELLTYLKGEVEKKGRVAPAATTTTSTAGKEPDNKPATAPEQQQQTQTATENKPAPQAETKSNSKRYLDDI